MKTLSSCEDTREQPSRKSFTGWHALFFGNQLFISRYSYITTSLSAVETDCTLNSVTPKWLNCICFLIHHLVSVIVSLINKRTLNDFLQLLQRFVSLTSILDKIKVRESLSARNTFLFTLFLNTRLFICWMKIKSVNIADSVDEFTSAVRITWHLCDDHWR